MNPKIHPDRFFNNIPWSCEFTCKYCKETTTINSKIRYSGGSILTETQEEEKVPFGPNIHYGFQCQECGEVANLNDYEEESNIVTTNNKCNCGGDLSRLYPIFCGHCKTNRIKDWDIQEYRTQVVEKYKEEQEYYKMLQKARNKTVDYTDDEIGDIRF